MAADAPPPALNAAAPSIASESNDGSASMRPISTPGAAALVSPAAVCVFVSCAVLTLLPIVVRGGGGGRSAAAAAGGRPAAAGGGGCGGRDALLIEQGEADGERERRRESEQGNGEGKGRDTQTRAEGRAPRQRPKRKTSTTMAYTKHNEAYDYHSTSTTAWTNTALLVSLHANERGPLLETLRLILSQTATTCDDRCAFKISREWEVCMHMHEGRKRRSKGDGEQRCTGGRGSKPARCTREEMQQKGARMQR